jgi:hypothetical protein
METKKMTLGEKLRENAKEEDDAKLKAARLAREAEVQRLSRVRDDRARLIERIRTAFTNNIAAGGANPVYKLVNDDHRDWVNECRFHHYVADKDIWIEFIDWLNSEDLRVKVLEKRDGMEIKWLDIGAEPTPTPEVEAD